MEKQKILRVGADFKNKWKNEDSYLIAEAQIRSDDGQHFLAIVVTADGLEAESSDFKRNEVVQQGEALLETLIEEKKEDARPIKQNRLLIYDWKGSLIRESDYPG